MLSFDGSVSERKCTVTGLMDAETPSKRRGNVPERGLDLGERGDEWRCWSVDSQREVRVRVLGGGEIGSVL